MGEGDGDPRPGEEAGALLGAADGDVDGAVVGVLPVVGAADEVPLGCPDGLADGFRLAVVAPAGVPGAALPGLVAVGLALAVLDALGDAVWPRAGRLDAGDPAGDWFAAGALLNAPVASSTMRLVAATPAALTAITPTFRRGGGSGWPACEGRVTGRDIRSGTAHSAERKMAVRPKPFRGGIAVVPAPLPRAAPSAPAP